MSPDLPLTSEASQAAGLRKAAVFLAGLDRRAADAVLAQMTPAQAQQLRQAAAEIERIDPEEQRRVAEEFCRLGPLASQRDPAGIELDDRLAQRVLCPAAAPAADPAAAPAPKFPPFRFLRQAEADKLAKILVTESPQVIALVLSHLRAQQAGSLLARLVPALQVDVIRRLVDLDETDPEILREVERGLETRLSEQIRMQRRRVAGLSAVAGILEAAEQGVGRQILANLAAHDRALAERLNGRRVEFADLTELDDRALGAVLAAVDVELAILALVGAAPATIDRFLEQFSEAEAQAIRHRLEHFGPVRLSDVEQARRELAETARQLALQGRIELPRKAGIPPNP